MTTLLTKSTTWRERMDAFFAGYSIVTQEEREQQRRKDEEQEHIRYPYTITARRYWKERRQRKEQELHHWLEIEERLLRAARQSKRYHQLKRAA